MSAQKSRRAEGAGGKSQEGARGRGSLYFQALPVLSGRLLLATPPWPEPGLKVVGSQRQGPVRSSWHRECQFQSTQTVLLQGLLKLGGAPPGRTHFLPSNLSDTSLLAGIMAPRPPLLPSWTGRSPLRRGLVQGGH